MTELAVLLADSDADARVAVREGLQERLADLAVRVESRGSFAEAATVADDGVDCVVTEADLGDGTGLALLERARDRRPTASGILYTTAGVDEIETAGRETTVTDLIVKDAPDAIERLATAVRTAHTHPVQASFPLPDGEDDRLATLAGFDLAAPSLAATLEDLTALVAQRFDGAHSEVNLVDRDRQVSFSHEAAGGPRTVPREDSICTFTILTPTDVLAVEDVQGDPRFARNDALADRDIRSYLGAPVVTTGGHALGTVCVWSETSRSFDATDERFLRTAADLAARLLAAIAAGTDATAIAGDAAGR